MAVENAVGILRWFEVREDGCGDKFIERVGGYTNHGELKV
jgi:hypothetical protein